MQCTVMSRSCGPVRPFKSQMHKPSFNKAPRAMVCLARAKHQQQQQAVAEARLGMDLLSLSLAGMMMQPLAAWADEALLTPEAAAGNTVDAPSWLGYVLVLSPIILYGIFNVYRSQVNPRIKYSDFLFIVAGVAVAANLVSILAFKVRLF